MDILSLIGWRTADLEGTGREAAGRTRLPTFKVGDQLQARVARLLHQRLAVVELLSGRLRAVAELRTPGGRPLAPGQHLRLKVTATSPRLTFQTVAAASTDGGAPPPEPRPASLIQLLEPSQVRRLIGELAALAAELKASADADTPQVTTLISALERLSGHLTPLDPGSEPEAMAAQLLARVRDGGLFFEQKLVSAVRTTSLDMAAGGEASRQPGSPSPLASGENQPVSHTQLLRADLKLHLQRLLIQLPALLEGLDLPQTLSEEGNRLLWPTVTTLLEAIDADQRQLADRRPDEAPAVMRHSMWVAGRDAPLRFNVYLPRKGGRGGGGKGASAATPMVSLLLDLERFGPLRVDIRERDIRKKKCLGVDFWTQTEAVGEELQAVTAPLIDILKVLYPQVDLKVGPAPNRIAAFEKNGETSHSGQNNRSRLDIRV
jgi:hypothetical protein